MGASGVWFSVHGLGGLQAEVNTDDWFCMLVTAGLKAEVDTDDWFCMLVTAGARGECHFTTPDAGHDWRDSQTAHSSGTTLKEATDFSCDFVSDLTWNIS